MESHSATHTPAERHSAAPSPTRLAFSATVHCLTGCGIGEVLGLVIATALGWHDLPSIALAVVLAFIFGYGLTLRPLLAGGMDLSQALRLALAADTLSIVVMEVVDNAILLMIPGAMDAGLTSLLFWGSLAVALAIAFAAAFPVNLWLIRRGRGHAVVHGSHSSHSSHGGHTPPAGHPGDGSMNDHSGHGEHPHAH
ncbi:MAG: DUF4396 domain-containing protein [Chloroflexota bacterium]|nr:DUF4396 domain-containing protein [Chloroflexota bacterium]